MSRAIKMIYQILGGLAIAVLVLSLGLLGWVQSLGSDDDFHIVHYDNDVIVKPEEHKMLNKVVLTLQPLREKPQAKAYFLLMGGSVQFSGAYDEVGSELRSSFHSFPLPFLGRGVRAFIIGVNLGQLDGSKPVKISLRYSLILKEPLEPMSIDPARVQLLVRPWTNAFPILMPSLPLFWGLIKEQPEAFLELWARMAPPFQLKITVPQGWMAVAPGQLTSTSELGEGTQFSWEYPLANFPPVFVAGRYVRVSREVEGKAIDLFLKSGHFKEETVNFLAEVAAKTLELYEGWFGSIEGRLKLVSVDFGSSEEELRIAGGQATTMIVFLNDDIFLTPVAPRGELAYRAAGLLAHELFHGFGPIGSGRSGFFLLEGLTNFAAMYALEKLFGPSAALPALAWHRKQYLQVHALGKDRPVATSTFAAYALVYGKGALILQALRDQLGEEAFFQGLGAFLKEFKQGVASVQDFQQTMEAASGQDLAGFFHQWLETTHLPIYEIQRIERSEAAGKYQTVVEVKNEGRGTALAPLVAFTANGQVKQMVKVPPGEIKTFTFVTEEPIEQVKIDPDQVSLVTTRKELEELKREGQYELHLRQAANLQKKGRFERAIREIKVALKLKPNSGYALYRLARAYQGREAYEKAIETYRRSMVAQQDKEWLVIWNPLRIGQCLNLLGQREEALEHYQAALERAQEQGDWKAQKAAEAALKELEGTAK